MPWTAFTTTCRLVCERDACVCGDTFCSSGHSRITTGWQQQQPTEQLRRLPLDWQPRSDELLAAAQNLATAVRLARSDTTTAEPSIAVVEAALTALEAQIK